MEQAAAIWPNRRFGVIEGAGVSRMNFATGPKSMRRALGLAGLVPLALAIPAQAENARVAEASGAATVELAAQIGALGTIADAPAAPAGITVERPQGRLVVGADKVQGRAIYGPRKAAAAGAMGFGSMPAGMPLSSARLTSSFGYRTHPLHGGSRMHAGVDLAAPTGTPVQATADGVVTSAGWRGGYGILVSLGHGGGVQTRYAHLSAIAVRPGTSVRAGDVIGYVGSTGNSTGPHLHYELRVNGQAVNPMGG